MKIEVYADVDAVAREAAKFSAKEAPDAFATRGKFVGGKTPWVILRDRAQEDVPWKGVHFVQVDERVAPEGDPDRNLTHLGESLLEHALLRPDQIHAMPVEASDIKGACMRYALWQKSQAPRLCLTSFIWGSDSTVAPLRWCRETPSWIERCRRRARGNLPGTEAHDADLPGHQSFLSGAMASTGNEKTRMRGRLQAGDVRPAALAGIVP